MPVGLALIGAFLRHFLFNMLFFFQYFPLVRIVYSKRLVLNVLFSLPGLWSSQCPFLSINVG